MQLFLVLFYCVVDGADELVLIVHSERRPCIAMSRKVIMYIVIIIIMILIDFVNIIIAIIVNYYQ